MLKTIYHKNPEIAVFQPLSPKKEDMAITKADRTRKPPTGRGLLRVSATMHAPTNPRMKDANSVLDFIKIIGLKPRTLGRLWFG